MAARRRSSAVPWIGECCSCIPISGAFRLLGDRLGDSLTFGVGVVGRRWVGVVSVLWGFGVSGDFSASWFSLCMGFFLTESYGVRFRGWAVVGCGLLNVFARIAFPLVGYPLITATPWPLVFLSLWMIYPCAWSRGMFGGWLLLARCVRFLPFLTDSTSMWPSCRRRTVPPGTLPSFWFSLGGS